MVVAYADREAKADASVSIESILSTALKVEDIMGNAAPAQKNLTLSKTGRVVLLYDGKTTGAAFLQKLAPLDRKHASFVKGGATLTWNLPAAQRAAEISAIQIPRDATPAPFAFEAELTAGHERLFVPLMHGLYNNAANFTIEGLTIVKEQR